MAAVTALIVVAAVLILARVGALAVPVPPAVLRWGSWVLVAAFALVGIVNLAPPADSYGRGWHVLFFGPLLLILAALCAVVARSPMPRRRP